MKLITRLSLSALLISLTSLAYADDGVSASMATAGQSVSKAMSTAGESVGHGMAVTGQAIDDSTITTLIKSEFLTDTDLNPFKIKVSTTKGVVTLRGSVENQMDYDKAVNTAKSVKGVTSVNASGLKVLNPTPTTPAKS